MKASTQDLRRAAIIRLEQWKEAESLSHEARDKCFEALTLYSNARGDEYYNCKVGDVIEFTKTDWRGQDDVIRMKITNFNASPENPDIVSIDGIRILRNGKAGTKQEHYHELPDTYSKIKIIERAATPSKE